jgi:hypothetical protein
MGLSVRMHGICGCDKGNTLDDMETIAMTEKNNKVTKVYRCKKCKLFFFIEVYMFYDDTHKGVKLYE